MAILFLLLFPLALSADAPPESLAVPDAIAAPESTAVEDLGNKMCPVMPEYEAETKWNTVYRGEKVYFCCNNCIDSFRRDPANYLARLPQFPTAATQEPDLPEDSARTTTAWQHTAWIVLIAAACFGIWRAIKLLLSRLSDRGKAPRPIVVELFVSVLAGLLVATLALNNGDLHYRLVKSEVMRDVHHATFYDHGFPPIPPRAKDVRQLQATYYRGNDERHELLFNGGNYLTAIMDVSLERLDGTPVQWGEDVSSEPLFLSFTIKQAPNTPARLFGSAIMEQMYLTKEYDALMGWKSPVPDRVSIQPSESEPGTWYARYPIGEISVASSARIDSETVTSADLTNLDGVSEEIAHWFIAYRDAGYPVRGPDDLRLAGIEGAAQKSISNALGDSITEGVVYVCQENIVDNRQIGARFHYGIKFEIIANGGVIGPESTLWLGSLSRSQKAAKGKIADDQWLSADPLPILPASQDVSEELLGLDDYPEL